MEIEIKLNQKEALEIIYKHFQPMFPDKLITGDIEPYGDVTLEVMDKKPESEEKSDEN